MVIRIGLFYNVRVSIGHFIGQFFLTVSVVVLQWLILFRLILFFLQVCSIIHAQSTQAWQTRICQMKSNLSMLNLVLLIILNRYGTVWATCGSYCQYGLVRLHCHCHLLSDTGNDDLSRLDSSSFFICITDEAVDISLLEFCSVFISCFLVFICFSGICRWNQAPDFL